MFGNPGCYKSGFAMPLKNITRVIVENGYMSRTIHRLIDPDGNFIDAFDRFSRHLILQHYPFSTRKRYSEACARFIDYLFELGILGGDTDQWQMNQAVENYPFLLRDGPNCTVSDYTSNPNSQLEACNLSEYAKAIGMKNGLSRASFAPTLAAINLFLTFSQALAREDALRVQESGVAVNEDWLSIRAIEGFTLLSSFQRARLKQNSMLAAVKRHCGEIRQPRGIRSPIKRGAQIDCRKLDFPLTDFARLISSATNYRDKALWTLLGASGIRESEALNLQLEHIDPVARRVYVQDPEQLRFAAQMTRDEKQRFKGRLISRTYLFEPLRSEFFSYYELYLRYEFTPTSSHSCVFQILQGKEHGKPLREASDSARVESFKRAVRRAGVNGPESAPEHVWTPHSLRHMYGVYMLNYIPVPGGFGLLDSEVQMLMGHRHIDSTKHYARHDETLLRAKLEAADRFIYCGDLDLLDLPSLIADRLNAQAQAFKLLAKKNHDQHNN